MGTRGGRGSQPMPEDGKVVGEVIAGARVRQRSGHQLHGVDPGKFGDRAVH